jgi:hypothetical protein
MSESVARAIGENDSMKWVLMPVAREEERGRFPLRRFGQWLAARGNRVALVYPPASPWDGITRARRRRFERSVARKYPLGVWQNENLFAFVPRTWLPVRPHWPFDGYAAWNACEAFSRPQAGELLREAGFDRADCLLMQSFEFPSLVRFPQPAAFAVVLDQSRRALRERTGEGAARKEKHVLMDADLVLCTRTAFAERAKAAGAERIEMLESALGNDAELFAETHARVTQLWKDSREASPPGSPTRS